ncbi:MAG: response regulator [Bradyrhizobium sp.]|nr:response regulator [Bradyrhizobium sp.]
MVDDDPAVLKGLQRLLETANFEVQAYPSGTEFLMSAMDVEFDCLVLDLHMPETSGFEVQTRLRQRARPPVPVVIITGRDTPEARARAYALGAKAYLCKPIDAAPLLAAIESVSRSPQAPDP